MARALESLRAALAQQAGVVAAWRVSLAELEGAVGSLQLSVGRQAGAVRDLGAQLAAPGTGSRASAQSAPR